MTTELIMASHPSCNHCSWVWRHSTFVLKVVNRICPQHGGGDRNSDAPARPSDREHDRRSERLTKAQMAARAAEVNEMRREGFTISQVAFKYGVYTSTVYDWLKHAAPGEP